MVKISLLIFTLLATVYSQNSVEYVDENNIHEIDQSSVTEEDLRYNPENDVSYLLFTRNNPLEPQKIQKWNKTSLISSNFDPNKPLKITVHGWIASQHSKAITIIRDAYLNATDCNLLAIDWSKGCNGDYVLASSNTPKTGVSIAEFLDWLVIDHEVDPKKIHVVGHSLGAHLIGHVGRNMKSGKLGYITGLDPAGPIWSELPGKLNKNDAEYVEAIHTNSLRLGMLEPIGHNDFYPNGGILMTGCTPLLVGCSHDRGISYIGESIRLNGKGFTSVSCDTLDDARKMTCNGSEVLHMGGLYPKPSVGILSLSTNGQSPFSLS